MVIAIIFIMGCSSENYGIYKREIGSEPNATRQKLVDNWSDYDILLIYNESFEPDRLISVIFDTKNDNMKILVETHWSKVKVEDQEMWTKIVKENAQLLGPWQDNANKDVQEIWGPDNQLYGYVITWASVVLDRVELVDKNTIQLSGHPPRPVGGH